MTPSRARRDIVRQRDRLNATFSRINVIDADATEARADFAKYLCVRVSGYLETSVAQLLQDFAARQSSPTVARYIRADLSRFQNARRGKILDLFERFDPLWRTDLEAYLVDERAGAIGNVITNRHKIAHGEDSDITYVRVKEDWKAVQAIVDHIADLTDPR